MNTVPDLTASIMEPLTVQMSEEQKKRKLDQQKAKAPPPGASRILTRATREQNKKNQAKQATAPTNPTAATPSNPPTLPNQSQKLNDIKITKTESPRTSRTPAAAVVEVTKSHKETTQTNDLEEWQNLAEDLNPEVNFELCEKTLQDEAFLAKLKQRLLAAKSLMLEARIEGASLFRELCKILCNLVSIEFNEEDEDEDSNSEVVSQSKKIKLSVKKERSVYSKRILAFEHFCNHLELPQFFTDLMRQLQSNAKISKEVFLMS